MVWFSYSRDVKMVRFSYSGYVKMVWFHTREMSSNAWKLWWPPIHWILLDTVWVSQFQWILCGPLDNVWVILHPLSDGYCVVRWILLLLKQAMPFMQSMLCQLCIQCRFCNSSNAHCACNAICAVCTMPIVHAMPFVQPTHAIQADNAFYAIYSMPIMHTMPFL